MTKKEMSITTKKNLQKAFWDLYENKRIEQISIKEITDLAGYNRGTFYLYYKDIYDILSQCEKSIWEDFCSPLKLERSQIESMPTEEIMQLIADTYAKQKRYMLILFGNHGDPAFHKMMKDDLKHFFAVHLNFLNHYQSIIREYLLEFYASGAISVLTKWFQNESDLDLNQFIALIHTALISPMIQLNNPQKTSELFPDCSIFCNIREETPPGHPSS